MRKLLIIFPVAVCHMIKDTENPVWRMVLKLREISNFVYAPALSYGQLAQFKECIDEYINLRVKCFPDIKLRPKHHYLKHYPDETEIFGPLKYSITLRNESKHRFFKNHVKHCPNFKNVTKSLAEKHQMNDSLITIEEPRVVIDVLENLSPTETPYINNVMKERSHFSD